MIAWRKLMPDWAAVADSRRDAGIRHRHDDVGVHRMLDRELLAHFVARFVDRSAEDGRIGPREIDVFECADGRLLWLRTACAIRAPFSSMISISPGSTSRTYSASIRSNAHVSDATHHASLQFAQNQRAKPARIADGDQSFRRQKKQRKCAFGVL